MQRLEDREKGGERVWLVRIGRDRAFVEEGDAEVEVGEGQGSEGLDENVDNHVWVVQVRVKLVAGGLLVYAAEAHGLIAYSLRMARLARQSYSSLRIW